MKRLLVILIALLVAVPVAGYFAVTRYAAARWSDPSYQTRECEAATQIASQIMWTRELGEKIFQAPEYHFDPHLSGQSPGAGLGMRSPGITDYLMRISSPRELNCTETFARAAVPRLAASSQRDEQYHSEYYRLSRLWLSDGDQKATLSVVMHCGSLCGYGWYTEWRKEGDHWRLESKKMLWIS